MNLGPMDYESTALTAELRARLNQLTFYRKFSGAPICARGFAIIGSGLSYAVDLETSGMALAAADLMVGAGVCSASSFEPG